MIKIKQLNKSFGDKKIIKNLDLHIREGEFVGIIGESGKGKTTLLNIIGTIERFDSGEIIIMDKKISEKKPHRILLRNHLGFIFQNYALIDNATVYDNLTLALKSRKLKKQEERFLIATALKNVGLDNYEKTKVFSLSGGEQQRIAIARLFLKNPDVILADEPTGSLDEENRNIIINLFQKLHQSGKTIVMVTHDLALSNYFSRVVKL